MNTSSMNIACILSTATVASSHRTDSIDFFELLLQIGKHRFLSELQRENCNCSEELLLSTEPRQSFKPHSLFAVLLVHDNISQLASSTVINVKITITPTRFTYTFYCGFLGFVACRGCRHRHDDDDVHDNAIVNIVVTTLSSSCDCCLDVITT